MTLNLASRKFSSAHPHYHKVPPLHGLQEISHWLFGSTSCLTLSFAQPRWTFPAPSATCALCICIPTMSCFHNAPQYCLPPPMPYNNNIEVKYKCAHWWVSVHVEL